MERIKTRFPASVSDYFMYVAPVPAPEPGGPSNLELAESRELVEFETDNEIIIAERNDFLIYTYDRLSDFVCKMAYGMTAHEMRIWLKKRIPGINKNSKVAFYLFRKMSSQTINTEKKIELAGTIVPVI